jgi:putative ABC transport system permease protein
VGSSRFPLLVMWAAVAFVLMIACVNVANLLLARSAARSREVAIRTALGAGRLRLLRQQLTESVALALAGGIAGVGLAVLGLDALLDWMPLEIPRLRDAAVDESVLAFTVAVSAITGMVSGMASAWTASGTRPVATLANGALAGSRGRNRLHGWLVVSELALAMVLTLGAGLMVRSLWLIDAGIEEFALDRVVAARYETSPPTQLGEMDGPRFTDAERGAAAVARANEGQRYDAETVARIEALPGVSAAAIWAQTTASGESLVRGPRGVARVDGSELGPSEIANVTPHYFAAAGMRLVAGRLFTEEDGQFGGPRIVIVNEAFLRPYELDPVSALGMELDGPAAQRIVGVVSDFRTRPDQPVRPQVFTPHSGGLIIANGYVWVRASGDPMAFEGQIRRILTRNGTTRMAEGETVADQMSASIAPRRFQGVLLISFAAMALALALVGTYGVLNYAVAERTREIGVRMALGATRRTVMGTVLGRGLAFGVTGIVIGIVGALALTQLIESLLYGVRPTDMWTYAAVSLIMLAVALAAAFLPAWRATRVDPINALRYE